MSTHAEDPFASIKTSVTRLREADRSLRLYGADQHRYELAPCLTEPELVAFEQAHDLKLPEDYRAFLSRVGNGGAGPNFGLNSLDDAARDCDLARAFPLTEGVLDEGPEKRFEILKGVVTECGLLQLSVKHYAWPEYLVVRGTAFGTVWRTGPDCIYWPEEKSFAAWYLD
jgi:hypothetical protein